MTFFVFVGIFTNKMNASLVYRNKMLLKSGAVLEMVIWKLPEPDADRPHGYKYRLFYGVRGQRLVGYDNERGKSDHRHYLDKEEPYSFSSADQLIADFFADVNRLEKKRCQEE